MIHVHSKEPRASSDGGDASGRSGGDDDDGHSLDGAWDGHALVLDGACDWALHLKLPQKTNMMQAICESLLHAACFNGETYTLAGTNCAVQTAQLIIFH